MRPLKTAEMYFQAGCALTTLAITIFVLTILFPLIFSFNQSTSTIILLLLSPCVIVVSLVTIKLSRARKSAARMWLAVTLVLFLLMTAPLFVDGFLEFW